MTSFPLAILRKNSTSAEEVEELPSINFLELFVQNASEAGFRYAST